MLTISGADWFSRRGGTCRLHAIYMNQPFIYMGKVGETVKYGWERHPRRGAVGPTPRMQNLVRPFDILSNITRPCATSASRAARVRSCHSPTMASRGHTENVGHI